MDKDLAALDKINPILAKIVDGQNLTATESEKIFKTVFIHDKEGLFFAALVTAIQTKRETGDELLGFIKATQKLSDPFDVGIKGNQMIDVSGSGGGAFKSFNVSTAVSLLLASAGYTVPKQAYFSITGATGSLDLFTAFGYDVSKTTRDHIVMLLRTVGIAPYQHIFISPGLANRLYLSVKFFKEQGVHVRTPMHLVSNICTPIPLRYRIYGLFDPEFLYEVAEALQKLDYTHSLVFWGEPGMPEISNVGKTILIEQRGSKLEKRELQPKDFGVRPAKPADIATGGKEQNIIDFLRVLAGQETGPKADLVAINAGAALYVLSAASSLSEGTRLAQQKLTEGAGLAKLKQLVEAAGNPELLQDWMRKARL